MGPFNPLEKKHLAESVANALESQPMVPLGAIERSDGAGVYLIYYSGPFESYSEVVERGSPIYIGKADPKGRRRGLQPLDAPVGSVLYDRLRQHARSIEQVANLSLNDFRCRYLVVDEIWIPLAESLLITKYEPLWNREISGFGIHTPGGGREGQQRSEWDTIHAGRPLAAKLPPNRRTPELMARFGAPRPRKPVK